MGNAGISFNQDSSVTLNKAILLYGERSNAYATIHDIKLDKKTGAASLTEGGAITHSALNEIMKGLSQSIQIGGYLPPHILSVGHNSVVWWLESAKQPVHFKCDGKVIGNESAIVPNPSLILAVNGSNWYVVAVKGNKRPLADTELFQAPYFNVWEGAKICIGNVNIPKDYSAKSTELWNKAFFDSAFTHPNIHAPNGLVKYKGGAYKFWRDMLDGKFKRFPEQVLVPMNITLEGFINSVNRGI